jgi:hypothetical protein
VHVLRCLENTQEESSIRVRLFVCCVCMRLLCVFISSSSLFRSTDRILLTSPLPPSLPPSLPPFPAHIAAHVRLL